jgi:2-polyprenyl-3-methyl-5-hydroxy-6-metoxy-1,4-benzoquinol methylase
MAIDGSATVTTTEFDGAWGLARIVHDDLQLLSEFTGESIEQCLQRLSSYRVNEMADAWYEQTPKEADEIRRFYSTTDLYLWELLAWNGSAGYESYLRQLDRMAELWPPDRFPLAVDYGSGVGTAALRLAELGYRVTIADVPGRTLDFARARIARHGIPIGVIEITEDGPELSAGAWDIIVSFDVLEHVPDPAAVGRALVRALAQGGGACIGVTFDLSNAEWPHHLPAGHKRFREHRWGLYFQGLGMKHIEGGWIFQKVGRGSARLRRLRYLLWRATGLHVERFPR